MIFSSLNIRRELVRERSRRQEILNNVNDLLKEAAEKDKEIHSRLKKSDGDSFNEIDIDEKANIFSIDEIRRICIRYRLRFLDTSHFKSEYPYDAIAEINAFEKKHDAKIESFRIIAPAEAFDLENINKDPLLFAQLNDKTFYLLHQWGHELKWHRRILAWPLQNLKTLLISLLTVCFLLAFSIPASVMNILNFESEIYLRIWLTIHMFIGFTGFTLWAGLTFDKTFSGLSWDSKYYNY